MAPKFKITVPEHIAGHEAIANLGNRRSDGRGTEPMYTRDEIIEYLTGTGPAPVSRVHRAMPNMRHAAQKRYAYTQDALKNMMRLAVEGEQDPEKRIRHDTVSGPMHASIPHNRPIVEGLERAQVMDYLMSRGLNPSVIALWPGTYHYSKFYPATDEVGVLHPHNNRPEMPFGFAVEHVVGAPGTQIQGMGFDGNIQYAEHKLPIQDVLSLGDVGIAPNRSLAMANPNRFYVSNRQDSATYNTRNFTIIRSPEVFNSAPIYVHHGGYYPRHTGAPPYQDAGFEGHPSHAREHSVTPTPVEVARMIYDLGKSEKWWRK